MVRSFASPMPFTFFAHQAFVLPLKVAKPRCFDGSALCVGSMAPDFVYAWIGTPFAFHSHTLRAQLTWTLPVTLLATHVIRRYLARPVGNQLPEPLGSEMRALAESKHPLWISAISALLGGFSHVFVDGFTHPHSWAALRIARLREYVLPGFTWADVLQYIGHSFGSLVGLAMFTCLVSQRCISRWNQSTPSRKPSQLDIEPAFWIWLGYGSLLCIPAAFSGFADGGGISVAIMRAFWVFAAVLLLAALRDKRRTFESSRISTG